MNLHLVSAAWPDDGALVDDDSPLVPEGTYRAAYVKHDVVRLDMFRGSTRLFITFRIVDPGPAFGVRLWRAFRVRPGKGARGFRVGRKAGLYRTIGRLAPETRLRADQLPIRETFAGRVFLVRVRSVKIGARQEALAPNCWYSVVDDILSAETDEACVRNVHPAP